MSGVTAATAPCRVSHPYTGGFMTRDFAEQLYDAACQEIGAAVVEIVSSGYPVTDEAIKLTLARYIEADNQLAMDTAIYLMQ